PGRMRKKQVYLRVQNAENPFGKEIGYRPPNPAALNGLIDQFVTWYASTDLNPVEKAALAHYKLYRIHPFLDGNKRMCRLILNKTLLDAGFPLLNISEKKERYFQSLISAVESAAPKGLAEFILKELFRQTKEFLTVHGAPAPRRRVPP
ncbi:MAG TPA: Fic family protein, partial [archaeon]|nr:Fic family protein [archaeon]